MKIYYFFCKQKKIIGFFTVFSICFLTGCGGKVVTYEQQLLFEADSLFKIGYYELAKSKYQKILLLTPNSPATRLAQYYLGYINVYYENDMASWEAALREFKKFLALYPDDVRADEVKSWIKILNAMQRFKKEYGSVKEELAKIKPSEKEECEVVPQQTSPLTIDALNESLRNCTHTKDSLLKKNKELENFILELEKECQEAGR